LLDFVAGSKMSSVVINGGQAGGEFIVQVKVRAARLPTLPGCFVMSLLILSNSLFLLFSLSLFSKHWNNKNCTTQSVEECIANRMLGARKMRKQSLETKKRRCPPTRLLH
jgi:hypothetical protein